MYLVCVDQHPVIQAHARKVDKLLSIDCILLYPCIIKKALVLYRYCATVGLLKHTNSNNNINQAKKEEEEKKKKIQSVSTTATTTTSTKQKRKNKQQQMMHCHTMKHGP